MDEQRTWISLLHYPSYRVGQTEYTGGSQEWFREMPEWKYLADYGCGLVAAADLLLSIQGKQPALDEFFTLTFMLNQRYTKIIKHIGLTGFSLAAGIRRYAKNRGIHLRTFWGVRRKNMLDEISRMLQADIPVILGIGRDLRITGRENGIWFYEETNSSCYKVCLGVGKIQSHYVTVTGIKYPVGGNSAMLKIVSWGKEYYINYGEYLRYIDRQPWGLGGLLSNVLNVSYVN